MINLPPAGFDRNRRLTAANENLCQSFDQLIVQVALQRLRDGTLDPTVLVALLAGVGVHQ